jgi:hypothetical protein
MIRKGEMIPMLVEACPSFLEKWQAHRQEYEDEIDYLPYIALGEFARHLIQLDSTNQVTEFEDVFDLVERLYLEGEDCVREAATIGLLEGLQNSLGADAEKFHKYLKPETLKWWNQLNRFWNGEIRFVGETMCGES